MSSAEKMTVDAQPRKSAFNTRIAKPDHHPITRPPHRR
jgi:hypothetical protein